MQHFGTYMYIHMNTVHALLPACLSQYNVLCVLSALLSACSSLAACLSHILSLSLSLSRTEPSAAVTNLSASLVGNGEHVANVLWSPLASEFWNGIPYGYYVSIIVMFTL